MASANLAITDNDTWAQYSSTGETDFAYGFPILSTDELRVSVDQVDKTLGVDYTVSGVGVESGGCVTFLLATTPGEVITIWQDMPFKRSTGFSTGAAALTGEGLNTEFVRQVRHDQQLRRDIRRSLRLAPDDPQGGGSLELPIRDDRAGKVLGFNASGVPTAVLLGASGDASLRADLASGLASFGNELVNIRRTDAEEDNGIQPVTTSFLPGNAFRYMTTAQIVDVLDRTRLLDVTGAVQNAVDSGHGAYITAGNPAIADTVTIVSGQSLLTNNNVALQRIGGSTEPVLHLYGNDSVFNGGGHGEVINDLNDHPHGVILVGQHPGEVAGGTTDVATRNSQVNFCKVRGPENGANPQENGAPVLYVHSLARKRGLFVNPTYKCQFHGLDLANGDKLFEFSSDANSHQIFGGRLQQWIAAAIWFNGAYGNCFYGIGMEFALFNLVLDNTKRYAIEFNEQNSGIESDTDPAYPFGAAASNSVNGYSELTNGAGAHLNRNIALLNPVVPASGIYGSNDVHILGSLGGGIGFGGSSKLESEVGTTNNIDVSATSIHNRGPRRVHGWNKKRLDDDSGSIRYKESQCEFSEHNALETLDATQRDLFSWDNIENAGRVATKIEVSYDCKVDGQLATQVGTIIWHARLSSNTVYDEVKILDQPGILPLGADESLFMNITLEAGTDTNTMKATVGFLSNGAAGTKWAVGYNVKLTTSSVDGSTIDWAEHVKIL